MIERPSQAKSILVVDDEEPILQAISYNLRKEGFAVHLAQNAEAALRRFREEQPDLVILDVMLPSASGLEVCRRIRVESQTPIILLTAKVDERDKVAGLDLGADDYVTKPFSVRELIARVNALLRRSVSVAIPKKQTIGDLEVDETRHEIRLRGQKLQLAPKEFALLAFLASNPGIVFSRQAILDRVWGVDAFVEERTVDVHIRWLRAKIEADPAKPTHLLTVRGLGYKFNAEHE